MPVTPTDADQRVSNFVELERLYDCSNELHMSKPW